MACCKAMVKAPLSYCIFLPTAWSPSTYGDHAAGLVQYILPRTPIYIIDPKTVATPATRQIHHIKKGASEGMKELTEILLKG